MTISNTFSMLLVCIAASIGVASAEDYATDFNGTWRGSFQKVDPNLQSNALPDVTNHPEYLEFAIEISESSTRVYIQWDNAWQEIKPGSFGSLTHKTNAIIAATDSRFSQDGKIGWVETWNFTITAKDSDSLYAYWVRAVNNPHLVDGSSQDARFILSRFGTLQRSEPVSGSNVIQASTAAPGSDCLQSHLICGSDYKTFDVDLEAREKIERQQ